MSVTEVTTREEYKENLRDELSLMDKDELKSFAKEHGIKLYTTQYSRMLQRIIDIMTVREFHGDAFRDKR